MISAFHIMPSGAKWCPASTPASTPTCPVRPLSTPFPSLHTLQLSTVRLFEPAQQSSLWQTAQQTFSFFWVPSNNPNSPNSRQPMPRPSASASSRFAGPPALPHTSAHTFARTGSGASGAGWLAGAATAGMSGAGASAGTRATEAGGLSGDRSWRPPTSARSSQDGARPLRRNQGALAYPKPMLSYAISSCVIQSNDELVLILTAFIISSLLLARLIISLCVADPFHCRVQ